MSDEFIFNGISSSSMGVVMNQKWIDDVPEIRYEEIAIEGRDGSILVPLNYKTVSKEVACTLLNKNRHAEIQSWLRGKGKLVLGGRYRQAYIFNQLKFQKNGPFREDFTIPFLLDPFWYLDGDAYAAYTSTVNNDGNVDAAPLLKITGTGTSSITINGLVFAVTLEAADVLVMDCLDKSENLPQKVSIGFDYPKLSPGANAIAVSGNAVINIMRKDRWIG